MAGPSTVASHNYVGHNCGVVLARLSRNAPADSYTRADIDVQVAQNDHPGESFLTARGTSPPPA